MIVFDRELFMKDLINSSNIMKFMEESLSNVNNKKMNYVSQQKFELTTEWRDIERFMERIDLEDIINKVRFVKMNYQRLKSRGILNQIEQELLTFHRQGAS